MTSISEQFSAVRQSQWEAQLDMFRQLSTHALDNTEQLIALNMRTSRATMEQAAGAVKQMLEMRDPRDLLTVGSSAQGQWHQLFAYGRELLGIATGMHGTWSTLPPALPFVPATVLPALSSAPSALRLIPAPVADLPASPSQAAEQASIAALDTATVFGEIEAAAVDIGGAMLESTLDGDADVAPSSEAAPAEAPAAIEPPAMAAAPAPAEPAAEPAAEAAEAPAALSAAPAQPDSPADAALAFADAASNTAIADDVPPLEATPLAQALNEVAPKPAGVEHPIVSTVPLEAAAAAIELPPVAPVEHTAPPTQPTKAPRTARKR